MLEVDPAPEMTSMGAESAYACPIAVATFVTPGPLMTKHTPGVPVTRAYPCAMNPAPCSCRVETWRIGEPARPR